MIEISTQDLAWNPKTSTFAVEASDLRLALSGPRASILQGLHVRSHRTGNCLWFVRKAEHRDQEGDLELVEFHGDLANGRRLRLLVFND